MNFTTLIVPLIAIALGLLVYFGCSNEKNKQATIGLYVFVCGFFILLWIITFHGIGRP